MVLVNKRKKKKSQLEIKKKAKGLIITEVFITSKEQSVNENERYISVCGGIEWFQFLNRKTLKWKLNRSEVKKYKITTTTTMVWNW